jgi:hypothetical protein
LIARGVEPFAPSNLLPGFAPAGWLSAAFCAFGLAVRNNFEQTKNLLQSVQFKIIMALTKR